MMRRQIPADVASRLHGVRPSGDGYVARCPAHDDHNPSLSVSVNDAGKLLLHCHAGCDQRTVLDAIQATPQMLDPHREERREQAGEWTPRGPAVAVYSYVDEAGTLLYEVCRTADKQFPQRRPDVSSKSGWTWSLGKARRILYRLPQVIAAVEAGETVWICEGEKDVHSLEACGVVATTSPGGAGKWRDEYAEIFPEGANVVIVADRDGPGQAHARAVGGSLGSRGVRVTIREPKAGKDVTEHLRASYGLADLLTTHEPDQPVTPDLAPDLWDFLDGGDPGYRWLMPGILERGDRLMITGYEGWGKSTLTRELALGLAAGIHPFTGENFTPARVLFIDCENSEKQLRRGLLRMLPIVTETYAQPPDRDMMYVLTKMGGIDLTSEEDAQWLLERATAHKPDVLFIGPLYYLYAEGANEEAAMRRVQSAIDAVRIRIGCAVVIEAHPGHGSFGKRPTRVAGSSVWLRWLESGIGLADIDGETDLKTFSPLEVINWKKHRYERSWPERLMHGEYDSRNQQWRDWPWVAVPGYDGPDLG
jgi:5S rRNA maturation endonuclease (ribonuclease M5)